MNRADLKKISLIRTHEAQILLKKKKYSGSYYIAGYAMECALKACIAKKTKKSEFPDKQAVIASYTHNLDNLIKSAGLEHDLNQEIARIRNFAIYWTVAKDWSEEARYEIKNRREAEDLLKAIIDPREGVLRWIKLYW